MNNKEIKKVYIISGPAGVGKSTISKELAKTFKNSAYISCDYISHMHINGRKKQWAVGINGMKMNIEKLRCLFEKIQ